LTLASARRPALARGPRLVARELDDAPAFLGRETREFAGGSVGIQAVDAAFNQPRDETPQLGFVDSAALVERTSVGVKMPCSFALIQHQTVPPRQCMAGSFPYKVYSRLSV